LGLIVRLGSLPAMQGSLICDQKESIVPVAVRFSAVRAAKLAVANLLQLHLVDGTGLVSDEHTEKQADAVIREVKKIAARMQRAAEAKKT
jgi:hypothetical protein